MPTPTPPPQPDPPDAESDPPGTPGKGARNPPAGIRYSVIVPTYNSHGDLGRLLSSLAGLQGELDGVEIIVVDDGSFDDTEDTTQKFYASFENIRYFYQKNRGPAAARNLGAEKAAGGILIFVDDDLLFPAGCLGSIKKAYAEDDGLCGLGVRAVNTTPSIFSDYNQRLGDFLISASRAKDGAYGYVSSRCYSFRRECLIKAGGHDEGYIWPAAEDRDLCRRMADKGMRVGFLSESPLLNVDELGFRGFVRQNFFYGMGACLLRRKNPGIAPLTIRRYMGLIRSTCQDRNPLREAAFLAIFALSQACTLAGAMQYRLDYGGNRPPSGAVPRTAILVETAKNMLLGLPFAKRLKNRLGSSTTGEELFSPNRLASAAFKAYEAYRVRLVTVSGEQNPFLGKRILEVGPGSNIAVPLLFLAAGAEKVVLIDRYGEVKSRRKERLIHEKILEVLPRSGRERIKKVLEGLGGGMPASGSSPVSYLPDTPIDGEKILERLPAGHFDLIVSTNTLEHVVDLRGAFRNMRGLLRDGGLLVHRVDAGTHYALARHTRNRLSHYTLSGGVFHMMFSNRGAPTRRGRSEYLRLLAAEGFRLIRCDEVETASQAELRGVEGLIDAGYAGITPGELAETGFFIVAAKG
jgi:glycosyltransferase involved in cell wall biosynthesis/SAM-dependent methyltransferase